MPGALIIAAFEPFEGRRRNRAWETVKRLAREDGRELEQLPVDFARLPAAISALLARAPGALLLVGEAPQPRVAVEQIALNVVDSERPDNAGRVVRDQPVDAQAPLALRASWDAQAVVAALRAAEVPAEVSFHAGTYACNASLFFALSSALSRPRPRPAVGFLHLPRARPPLGPHLRVLVRAVEIAARALAAVQP